MKRKALILGALPQPFEGPWVEIGDADHWTVTPGLGQESRLRLVVEETNGELRSLTLTGRTEFSGKRAKVVVLDGIESDHMVTLVAEEVRNGST